MGIVYKSLYIHLFRFTVQVIKARQCGMESRVCLLSVSCNVIDCKIHFESHQIKNIIQQIN